MPHLRECWRFTLNFNEFMMNRLEQLTAFLQAKAAKELHSLSELQSAKLALEYDED